MAISSDLQVTIVLDAALLAFRRSLLPLRKFSIGFRRDQAPLMRGDKMRVPYYPLETGASKDFNGTYAFEQGTADDREVTVNKRKYQPLLITSAEMSRNNFDPEELGRQKGAKLAQDVVADVLSLVTVANYGAHVFSGAASTFDSSDVADIQLAAKRANWPDGGILALDHAYTTSLLKDADIKQVNHSDTVDPLREGLLPRLSGFDVVGSNEIPLNGENLIGFAAHSSAILVGFSPVTPAPSVLAALTDYRVIVDPETGIILEYRSWGDPGTDAHKEVIECNYGYAVGEASALLRLRSGAPA